MKNYRSIASNASYLNALASGKTQGGEQGIITKPKILINPREKSNILIKPNEFIKIKNSYEVF